MNVTPPQPTGPGSPAGCGPIHSRHPPTTPKSAAYRVVNARVPADLAPALADRAGADRFAACEIVVDGAQISMLGAPGAFPVAADLPTVDLRDGIVLPRFVDAHTHLDKGHIWPRSPNPDGSFFGARETVMADRESRWVADDVRARMDFALRCAFAHGTGAIRTHLNSIGKQTAITWPLFAEMREQWKGRIALQGVALFPVDIAAEDEPQFRTIVQAVARHGGILGGVTFLGDPPGPKLELALDRIFAAALANGLDLDLHVDESCSPDARSLERIALAAQRHRFEGRIVAGHCCSLAQASDADCARVIERIGEAGVAVVSLPMCNMYLQDRTARRDAAAARGRPAARARRRRGCSDGRERQYARSVLRLRRSRHAGSVPRGDAHSPPRPFRAALDPHAGRRLGRGHGARRPRDDCRRANAPIWS